MWKYISESKYKYKTKIGILFKIGHLNNSNPDKLEFYLPKFL